MGPIMVLMREDICTNHPRIKWRIMIEEFLVAANMILAHLNMQNPIPHNQERGLHPPNSDLNNNP